MIQIVQLLLIVAGLLALLVGWVIASFPVALAGLVALALALLVEGGAVGTGRFTS